MNALSGLRYDLLQSTDIGGAFNRGMEMGTQMRERRDQRNALNLYATDPAGAINALMPVNPEMAMRLNDDYRAGEKTKREATFREAASGYIGGDGDAADAEFLRMVEIDPMAAMKIKSAKRDEAFDRLKSVDGAYDIAIQHLGSVTDEAGYQAVLGAVTVFGGDGRGASCRRRDPRDCFDSSVERRGVVLFGEGGATG